MRCIILAAGQGTRLRPYTNNLPKCMVLLKGRRLINYQIDILNAYGIDDLLAVGGYLSKKLLTIFPQIKENKEFKDTNMVYTLMCAKTELLDGAIVAYGDIVYSKKILDKLISTESEISVVVDDNWLPYWEQRNPNVLEDAESLKVNDDGEITEIGGKANSIDEIQSQYIGLLKVSRQGAKKLVDLYHMCEKNGYINNKPYKQAYLTDLLQHAINENIKVRAVRCCDPWIEVDTVEDLKNPHTAKRLELILNEE